MLWDDTKLIVAELGKDGAVKSSRYVGEGLRRGKVN